MGQHSSGNSSGNSAGNSVGKQALWIGRTIGDGDRYRLDQHLGGGGMGDVFLAMDTRLGKPVALKLLKDSLANAHDVDFKQRFERECGICAALKSVHIVQVSDYGVTPEGYPFYVMEYLQGQTLRQLLLTRPQLSVEQAGNIIMQACTGLHLAHSGILLWNRNTNDNEHIKVVHRDLKPDNIFLVPTALGEFVKIIDFGIAKIQSLQTEYTPATRLFLGTCHYASPEQFDPRGAVDERSDIYSLGVILYELLTGTDPFGFDFPQNRVTNQAWLSAHANTPPQSLRSHPHTQHLSPTLEAVVMRCLEKSPTDRFASVMELKIALQDAIGPVRSLKLPPLEAPLPATPPESSTLPRSCPSTLQAGQSSRSSQPRRSAWLTLASTLLVLAIGSYAVPRLSSFSIAASETPIALPVPPKSSLSLVETLAGSGPVWSAVVGADRQTLISAGADQQASLYPIEVWNLNSRQIQRRLNAHTDVVQSLSLSQDGQQLASGSRDRTIKLWNLATGELLRSFEGHTGEVWAVALSPDGQHLVSGSQDQTVRIWDIRTGESRVLSAHGAAVRSVAFSPDGMTIASSGADKTIRLWQAETGELIRTLGEPGGHRQTVSAVAFSPDGQQLASAGADGFVKLWNTTTGQLLQTFSGHSNQVESVAFVSPQTIASAGSDKTIKLWEAETGRLLQTIPAHADRVLSITSAVDQTLVSSSSDTTIKMWR